MTSTTPAPDKNRQRLLMQIIIGSAWVDGELKPSETDYLTQVLQRYRLANDQELQALLTVPVNMQQTELWMLQYLQDTTDEDRQKALASIAKLLIADEVVSDVEHDLLDDFYEMMAAVPVHNEAIATVVKTLGQFVRKAAETVGKVVSDLEKSLDEKK